MLAIYIKYIMLVISLAHIFVAWVIINLIIYKKQINLYTLFIQVSLTILVYIHSENKHSKNFKIQLFLSGFLTYAMLFDYSEIPWFQAVSYIFIGKYWYIWQTFNHYKKQFNTQLERYKIDKIFNAFTYTIRFFIISKLVGLILGIFHLHIFEKNQVHLALFKAIGQLLPSSLNNGLRGTLLMNALYTTIIYLVMELVKKLIINKSQLNSQQAVLSKVTLTTKQKVQSKEPNKYKKNDKK